MKTTTKKRFNVLDESDYGGEEDFQEEEASNTRVEVAGGQQDTMMDILLRLEKNSATHSASLASLEGTVKSSKLTLDNLSKDVKAIRDTIG
ncbi:unnamed protein product, partial [Allacma fusca]